MGMCGVGQTQTSANIRANKVLEEQRQRMKDEVTLLFLGPGESGKSTIFKQMRFIYGNGFSRHEMEFYLGEMKLNIIGQMKVLVEAAMLFDIKVEKKNKKKSRRILEIDPSVDEWSIGLAEIIKELWQDEGIQEAYKERSRFQLNDSCKYFMDRIDQILEEGFLPSQDDILRSRVKTVGAVEEKFTIDQLTFRMIDVGGQRSERRKWLPCFADVTSVLFIIGISEYDQKLREDNDQNRMIESISLFEQVCNSVYFKTTNFILFFNKVDLLKEKLERSDLSKLFPSYEGGTDVEKAKAFLVNRFIERNHSPHQVFYHFTCAIDTESFGKVFSDVKDSLVNEVMQSVQHI